MLIQATNIAAGGLANIERQLALVSQNVANAQTPGYAREIGTQSSGDQGTVLLGVRTGLAQRDVDTALQNAGYEQDASVAGLTARASALSAIDSVQGTPGQGRDLSGALATLTAGFTKLADDPSNAAQASAVVGDAGVLTGHLNTLSRVVQQQRQAAQDGLATDVTTLNASLRKVGQLSDAIIAAKSDGSDTAGLENQRDAAIKTLTPLLDVQVTQLPNGDAQLIGSGGLVLPTRAARGPFAVAPATLGASSVYSSDPASSSAPAVTLSGLDVTTALRGGKIGAALTLRDQTLPSYQAQLDEFAQTLSTRFDAQGLTLFSQPDGTLPTTGGTPVQSGYLGYAGTISVNRAVVSNPTAVRDGTAPANPPGGPASFSGVINNVLDYALGSNSAAGTPWTPPNATGLGADGSQSLPYAAAPSLSGFASSLVGAQASDSAATTSDLTIETGLQSSISQRITSQSGVSVDTELAHLTVLQNAYGANAKVITAAQALWTALLAAVQ